MLEEFIENRRKVLRESDGAGGDGGLDNIGNVDSALGGSSNRNGTRLGVSGGGAAVVVRSRNEGTTSGDGTRCRASGQSSGDTGGLGGGVGRGDDGQAGAAAGRLQGCGDAGNGV